MREKFATTNPRFVEVFSAFMERVRTTVGQGKTFGQPLPLDLPLFIRGRQALTREEEAQLLSRNGVDPGPRLLIRDLQDWRTLQNVSEGWFSSVPISTVATVPAGLVDFPEPQQCTLVWTGALSATQRTKLLALKGLDPATQQILAARPAALPAGLTIVGRELRWTGPPPGNAAALTSLPGDENFLDGIRRLLEAIPASAPASHVTAVPLTDVLTGVAPIGFDQVPRGLPVTVTTAGGNYTGLTLGSRLSRDVAALKRWAPMGDHVASVDRALGFETAMAAPDPAVRPRPVPRPLQSELPAGLAAHLTIEPLALRWTGALEDPSLLAALRSLVADDAFNQALARLLAFLEGPLAVTFATPVPARPVTLEAELQDQLLIGRAVVRYHGLMTVDEGKQLKSAYPGKPDQAAIQRLFDASINRGLAGSRLLVRARRGSAAPSEMVPLQGELIS